MAIFKKAMDSLFGAGSIVEYLEMIHRKTHIPLGTLAAMADLRLSKYYDWKSRKGRPLVTTVLQTNDIGFCMRNEKPSFVMPENISTRLDTDE